MGKVSISQVDAAFNQAFDTYSESIFSFCMVRLHCHADLPYAQQIAYGAAILFMKGVKSMVNVTKSQLVRLFDDKDMQQELFD